MNVCILCVRVGKCFVGCARERTVEAAVRRVEKKTRWPHQEIFVRCCEDAVGDKTRTMQARDLIR